MLKRIKDLILEHKVLAIALLVIAVVAIVIL